MLVLSSANRSAEIRRKRRQWRSWVERIADELQYQNVSRRTFEEVGQIVLSNPKVQQPSHFHEWLSRNYGLASAAAVRRLTDNRTDSVSLVRLLSEISQDPGVVNRKSFLSLYQKGMRNLANQKFDELTGNHKAQSLPKNRVDRDLREVRRISTRLRRFVNKRLAHLDQKSSLRTLPTFNDLHSVVKTLERIGSKYRFLLTGIETHENPLPLNWDSIFLEPWKDDSKC
jgi:AbiU2